MNQMNLPRVSGASVDAIQEAPRENTINVAWDLLALMRFLLAFVVIQFHQCYFFQPSPFNSFIAQFGGKAAVVGFLVLSGFSIHASMARRRENFVARRFLRIYPAYIVALLFSLLLQYCFPVYAAPQIVFPPNPLTDYVCNAALLQMFACKAIAYDSVVWSLSIEFSFYLFVFFATGLSERVILGLALASLVIFCLPHDLFDARWFQLLMRFNPAKYLWAFLFGHLLFRRHAVWELASLGLLSALAFAVSPESWEVLGPLTILATFAMIGVATRRHGARSKTLNYLGDLSYPLYLIHMPVYIALGGFLGVAGASALTLAALLAAVVTLEVFEKPFRRSLHRFGSLRV